MQKEWDNIFDNSLKNTMALEQIIYEAVPMYKENPTLEMKYLITKLCNNAKGQIGLLIEMLPKVSSGEFLKSYKAKLQSKYDELFDIEREISEIKHK